MPVCVSSCHDNQYLFTIYMPLLNILNHLYIIPILTFLTGRARAALKPPRHVRPASVQWLAATDHGLHQVQEDGQGQDRLVTWVSADHWMKQRSSGFLR